jgi:hypothetical protein
MYFLVAAQKEKQVLLSMEQHLVHHGVVVTPEFEPLSALVQVILEPMHGQQWSMTLTQISRMPLLG